MNKIRFLRLQKAMKQDELAKIIHVSQSSLSGYENEKYEPDKKTLLQLAAYFGVSIDYLLGTDRTYAQQKNCCAKIPVYASLRSEPGPDNCGTILYFLNFEPHPEDSSEYFGILARGDLMEPRICHGDIAIAHRQTFVADGDVAVVQVANRNAGIIRVVTNRDGIMLLPYNPNRKMFFYTTKEIEELPVRILGKVIEFHGKC
ncbi:MAG: XRE family transcriptional regulator [Oscillospiraceae bacterium]|jgi:repressor LexA|nr:XRE family transcriptional regulator [Oscillospiraceae bacterium]